MTLTYSYALRILFFDINCRIPKHQFDEIGIFIQLMDNCYSKHYHYETYHIQLRRTTHLNSRPYRSKIKPAV